MFMPLYLPPFRQAILFIPFLRFALGVGGEEAGDGDVVGVVDASDIGFDVGGRAAEDGDGSADFAGCVLQEVGVFFAQYVDVEADPVACQ